MSKLLSIAVLLMMVVMLEGCTIGSRDRQSVSNPSVNSENEVFLKAEAAYNEKRFAEAEELYLKALDKEPDQYDAIYKLGNIAFRAKQYRKARDFYLQVLALDRNYAKAHYNLATANLILAEQHFRFFLTTKKKDEGNTPSVIKVMADINNFARGGSRSPATSDVTEDAVMEAIADELAF